MVVKIIRWLFLSLILVFPPTTFAQTTNDVTSTIETLGNPAKQRWEDANNPCRYARNVWDLQSFGGKLYIGSGNSSNVAPCLNAGPVNVMSYNPTTNGFVNEYTVSEEQIDKYEILNGVLTIPGHDGRYGDGLTWYTYDSGTWNRRTGPTTTVHTYDMEVFNGMLVAVGNTNTLTASQIQISTNNGQTWSSSNLLDPFSTHALFILQNKLYAVRLTQSATPSTVGLYQYTSGTTFTPMSNYLYNNMSLLYPSMNISTTPNTKMTRAVNFNNALVYIGAVGINDHQSDPFGLFKVTNITTTTTDASKITLPGNAKPWDTLLGSNGKIYVLGSIPNASRYWVTVISSSDLTTWTEEFRFDAPLFARSFEQLNGDWYFGLGTDTTNLSVNTGDILRYKASTLASPTPATTSAPTPKPGDIIQNDKVDLYDYNALLTDFGKKNDAVTKADLDDDNDVDLYDYNILLTNFGR